MAKYNSFDIACLSNLVMDITINVSDKDEKEQLVRLKKEGIAGDADSLREFEYQIMSRNPKKTTGGSPANVALTSAFLGLKTTVLGTLGTDRNAAEYIDISKNSGIKPLVNICKGSSGLCYVFVTPDGERSHYALTGVATTHGFDLSALKHTKILHTSGHELATNPERVMETIDYTLGLGAKISFDLAHRHMVQKQKHNLESLLKNVTVLFMTEKESEALTGSNPYDSLLEMSRICPIVALKKGARGSVVRSNNLQYEIPAYPVKIVNTNGAGDSYAAGFLFGYLKRFSIAECGHFGSFIASRICARNEPHF